MGVLLRPVHWAYFRVFCERFRFVWARVVEVSLPILAHETWVTSPLRVPYVSWGYLTAGWVLSDGGFWGIPELTPSFYYDVGGFPRNPLLAVKRKPPPAVEKWKLEGYLYRKYGPRPVGRQVIHNLCIARKLVFRTT